MKIEKQRIAAYLTAITLSKDKRFCTHFCKILLRRLSHYVQITSPCLVICLPRKEEDH